MTPRLLVSVPLAAVLAGLAFAVFGAAGTRTLDPVAQAATISSSAPGYQMRLSMEVSSSASATPLTAIGTGSFDLRDHVGSLSLTMNVGSDPQVIQTLGSNDFTMQEILNGATVYVKLPAAAVNAAPFAGKSWIEVDLAKVTGIPGLSSLAGNPASSDPSQMLQYLRAASGSVAAVGRQRVDGVLTTHYRANLSLDRILAALPSPDQAAAQRALSVLAQATHITGFPVDVWVDAHHLVRRIEMTITASTAGAPATSEVVTIDISHYGPQPRPALPPAGEVANLNGLVGSGG